MPVDRTSAELIRETEHQRLKALVAGEIELANSLHSDDYQLITPNGQTITKQDYIGGIASGDLVYSLCSSPHPTLLSVSMGMPPRSATKRASRSGSPTSATPACSGTRTSTRRGMGAGRRSGRRQPGFPRGLNEPPRDAKVTDARCIRRNGLAPAVASN